MSASSLDVSQSSSEDHEGDNPTSETPWKLEKAPTGPLAYISARDILLFLIAFRLLNALSVRTFFQPDEFFQSLEPAWETVFGQQSGAWITWEWKEHLRSALHPAIFSMIYYAADSLARILSLSATSRADLLIATPSALQGVLSAIADYYTWKMAGLAYGENSQEAWATLMLTVVSPWQWFCSTRTFSNCLETCLTIFALNKWPWASSSSDLSRGGQGATNLQAPSKKSDATVDSVGSTSSLRACLMSAAFASILRPTNILIWTVLGCSTWFRINRESSSSNPSRENNIVGAWRRLRPSVRLSSAERAEFLREAFLCGSTVFAASAVGDRLYYGSWTLPPLNFFYVNVIQSLAGFYGRNDWHYYLTQGYPLLLTTALPFTVPGIYSVLTASPISKRSSSNGIMLYQLVCISLVLPMFLSLLAHKEVRFIYPILPCLHVLTAPGLVFFFGPVLNNSTCKSDLPRASIFMRRILLAFLLSINVLVATYTTMIHARGSLAVIDYLRQQYSAHYVTHSPSVSSFDIMTVGFLMPCHSTPWRSHLVFSGIEAWALTCEPPLNMTSDEKFGYLDEADQFYKDPTLWLRKNMAHHPPRPKRLFSSKGPSKYARGMIFADNKAVAGMGSLKDWPEYLVFFEQLENLMQTQLRSSGYVECWRSFNTRWIDDWRRQGDIIVWCLYPERRSETSETGPRLSSKVASQARNTIATIGSKAQVLIRTASFGRGNESRERNN